MRLFTAGLNNIRNIGNPEQPQHSSWDMKIISNASDKPCSYFAFKWR